MLGLIFDRTRDKVNFLPFASYACKIRNNLPLSLRRDVAEILLKVALNTNQSLCPLTSKMGIILLFP
jgi:hypothetical protein